MFFGRYEIQVLDSFDNLTYADGQAAAIYGQYPPLVNASRKPGEWQTLRHRLHRPPVQGRRLPRVARLRHGAAQRRARAQPHGPARPDGLPRLAQVPPHGPKGPILLQDHGNPVRFRNIWVRPVKGYDEG